MANTKTFPHAVIYGGVFYPANTPIKVAEEKATSSKMEQVEKPTKKAVKKDDNERAI